MSKIKYATNIVVLIRFVIQHKHLLILVKKKTTKIDVINKRDTHIKH